MEQSPRSKLLARALEGAQRDMERMIEQGAGSDHAPTRAAMEAAHGRIVSALKQDALLQDLERAEEPDDRADRLCRLLNERYGAKLSFGYIGNCSMGGGQKFDDRSFRFFTTWKDQTMQSICFGYASTNSVPHLVERAMTELEPWMIEMACRHNGIHQMKVEAVADWINEHYRCAGTDEHLVRLTAVPNAPADSPKWTMSGEAGWQQKLIHEAQTTRGQGAAKAALLFLRAFNPDAYWSMRLQVEREAHVEPTPDGRGAQVMRAGVSAPLFGATGSDTLAKNLRVAMYSAVKQLFSESERENVVSFAFAVRNKAPSMG